MHYKTQIRFFRSSGAAVPDVFVDELHNRESRVSIVDARDLLLLKLCPGYFNLGPKLVELRLVQFLALC